MTSSTAPRSTIKSKSAISLLDLSLLRHHQRGKICQCWVSPASPLSSAGIWLREALLPNQRVIGLWNMRPMKVCCKARLPRQLKSQSFSKIGPRCLTDPSNQNQWRLLRLRDLAFDNIAMKARKDSANKSWDIKGQRLLQKTLNCSCQGPKFVMKTVTFKKLWTWSVLPGARRVLAVRALFPKRTL